MPPKPTTLATVGAKSPPIIAVFSPIAGPIDGSATVPSAPRPEGDHHLLPPLSFLSENEMVCWQKKFRDQYARMRAYWCRNWLPGQSVLNDVLNR